MENKFGELIRDKMSGHIAPIIGINKHGFVAATKHNSGLHRFLPEEEGIQFEFIGEKDADGSSSGSNLFGLKFTGFNHCKLTGHVAHYTIRQVIATHNQALSSH